MSLVSGHGRQRRRPLVALCRSHCQAVSLSSSSPSLVGFMQGRAGPEPGADRTKPTRISSPVACFPRDDHDGNPSFSGGGGTGVLRIVNWFAGFFFASTCVAHHPQPVFPRYLQNEDDHPNSGVSRCLHPVQSEVTNPSFHPVITIVRSWSSPQLPPRPGMW